MRNETKRLFSDKHIFDYRRNQKETMRTEISNLGSSELENSIDYLKLVFAAKYTPSQIRLQDPQKENIGEVEIKEKFNRFGNIGEIIHTKNRIKIKLLFEGESHLFKTEPSEGLLNKPIYNELHDHEVVYYVDYTLQRKDTEKISRKIESEIEDWVNCVTLFVNSINDDVQNMQSHLRRDAGKAINRREKEVSKNKEVLEAVGVDTNEPDKSGYIAPKKKREIELPAPNDIDENKIILQEETFHHIIGILDDLSVSLQRSNSVIRDLDEEPLRDIIMGGINTHYGIATSESFNRSGKTDILLRYNNENLFICECKFWKGKSHYQKTVDQLLRNLAQRDTHAALLIFSRRQDFRLVREKLVKATESHANYKNKISDLSDGGIYKFQSESKTNVKVAIILVDLYNGE